MIYINAILFTLAFVMYAKWQFVSDFGGVKGKWHVWGWIMRILFFTAIPLTRFHPAPYDDLFLAGCICIIVYEVGINVIALHQKAFYNGSTSAIDKKFGKLKWIGYFALLLAAAVWKFINFKKEKLHE